MTALLGAEVHRRISRRTVTVDDVGELRVVIAREQHLVRHPVRPTGGPQHRVPPGHRRRTRSGQPAPGLPHHAVAQPAHVGVDHDRPAAPFAAVGHHHPRNSAAVGQQPFDPRAVFDDPAAGLDGGDQRLDKGVDPALHTVAAQRKLNVRNAIQRRRGATWIAAIVGGVAAQQHAQVRLAHMTIDTGRHAAQRVRSQEGSRATQGQARHRRPGGRGAEHEVGGDRLPDPAAVGEERGQLCLGVGPEGGGDVGQCALGIVGHIDHTAVGVAVAEARVETTQADHVIEAQTRAAEHVGEDFRQGQHAGTGLDRHPVDVDGSGLAAGMPAGFEYPHRQPSGGQRQGGGQAADTGPDDEDLGTAISAHQVFAGQEAGGQAAGGPDGSAG